MSKLTKELLISKGVKFVTERNEIYFSVASLKKKLIGFKYHKSDVLKKEINEQEVQVIKLEDIVSGEFIEVNIISADGYSTSEKDVKNIEVKDAEVLTCKKPCKDKEKCDKKACE